MIFYRQKSFYYTLCAILVFFLLSAGVMLCLWKLHEKGVTNFATPDAQFINMFDKIKRDARTNIDGPALCLVGGSGTLYSVSADQLSRALNVPVVNLGLHAGLSTPYLLFWAQSIVQPGDVVVLLLESTILGVDKNKAITWTCANWSLPYNPEYLCSLNFKSLIQLASKLTLEEYWSRIKAAFIGEPEITSYTKTIMANRYGDLIGNPARKRSPERMLTLDKDIAKARYYAISPYMQDVLKDFITWCKQNNIFVLAATPASAYSPNYENAQQQELMDNTSASWQELGVEFLGRPQDFLFDKNFFYDTWFHMHSQGAKVMTARLAEFLRPALPENRLGPYIAPQKMEVDFTLPAPSGIIDFIGFSPPEDWGCWTDGGTVAIEFNRPMPAELTITLEIKHFFQPNLQTPIIIEAGEAKELLLVDHTGVFTIHLRPSPDTYVLNIKIPVKGSAKELGYGNDDRMLGLGINKLTFSPAF